MIAYPIRAVRALGFLKQPYNDVEIYVEDSTSHNMHLLLFKKLVGPNIRLESVNQVGDRSRLVRACRADQVDDGRKRLYVIDGDFDVLFGRKKPRLKYLYQLKAYDIENILVSQSALAAIGMIADTNATENDVLARLDFEKWAQVVADAFLPLFMVYAVTNSLLPSLETVGFSVQKLCDNSSTGIVPAKRKVRARVRELLKAAYAQAGRDAYIVARRRVKKALARRGGPSYDVISGRRYLLPLLLVRMQKLFGYNGKLDQLKTLLASYYDPGRERALAKAVRKALR